ncbi:uncharacterized protein NDAI_0G03490 [Naumovozyma dairenensis CBS 421]|uniref:Uncharacterized protein n=1 Tax=Naumovozyma dairenensis (strain ATCC 10597 / BCRC 20456 / CBS 421 / NBRC 0211 / NRRL Y-12639) TaxID=1071378 RepID=G0WEB5_NAUDC|nr:hypothetical protein NDAI_0G03490 [Naumovozyma dairenensis CBS 421]CCD26126.2 hypothetical protein NDAI_0G03490 [Naumovozyma dairenensis CBS 421]
MPLELPGFYFDEERGRYFRITELTGTTRTAISRDPNESERIYNREEIKRRKLTELNAKNYEEVKQECNAVYQEHMMKVADPYYRLIEVEKTRAILEGLRFHNRRVVMNQSDLNLAGHEGCYISNSDELNPALGEFTGFFIPVNASRWGTELICATSNGSLIRVLRDLSLDTESAYEFEMISESNMDSFTNIQKELVIKCRTIRLDGLLIKDVGLYYHLVKEGSTDHVFMYNGGSSTLTRRVELKGEDKDHIGDSVNISLNEGFIVAVNNKLLIHKWSYNQDFYKETLDKGLTSDIVTLAISPAARTKERILNIGCRNGWIYTVPIKEGKLLVSGRKCFKNPLNVRSIITIKAGISPGILFVSAISKNNAQSLFMFDASLEIPTGMNRPFVIFQTGQHNMAKETEFFDVSPDDHFLCYGSKNANSGKGDFEIFSIKKGDNLISESVNGSVKFSPIREYCDYSSHIPQGCRLITTCFSRLETTSMPRNLKIKANSNENMIYEDGQTGSVKMKSGNYRHGVPNLIICGTESESNEFFSSLYLGSVELY